MKKTAIICTALLALTCSATAFAASSSETLADKLGIPTGTTIFAAETTEKEKPAEQQKKTEKATSMDLVLILKPENRFSDLSRSRRICLGRTKLYLIARRLCILFVIVKAARLPLAAIGIQPMTALKRLILICGFTIRQRTIQICI